MNTTDFYLNDEQTDVVTVQWEDEWAKTIVYRNKVKLGEIQDKDNLKMGQPLLSSDGKLLFIQLKEPFFGKPDLELLVDGNPYSYREPSTANKIHKIYNSILFIAAIYFFLGLQSIFKNSAEIDKSGFKYYSVIFGLIFLGLGLAFRYKKSLVAVVIMACIMLLDVILYLISIVQLDLMDMNLEGIIVRIAILALFVRGGYYIILQRKEDKVNSATTTIKVQDES